MEKLKTIAIFILAGFLLASSCNKDNPPPVDNTGRLSLSFFHLVDAHVVEFDTMKYVNAAGNPYLVSEIQYFISDVTLHNTNGTYHLLDAWEDIHYVDTDLYETLKYALKDSILPGTYDSLIFTFGISEEKNQSLMFVNAPESNMFWPEYLGGGYHYLKLNGKWKDTGDTVRPYNFHMGIGQIYDPDSGNITGFVQNYYRVAFQYNFEIEAGDEFIIPIDMHVDQWFENPHIFDFNVWGGDIMQKQDAMQVAKENGHSVFQKSLIIAD